MRRLTGWSQHTLGGVTGLAQAAISGIERGEHRLRDIELIAGVADALQIPPALLNLPNIRATVGEQGNTEPTEVSWVARRDFGQHVAATVLGITTAAQLDTDRLLALLPQAEPTGTRNIGTADVEAIEHLTAAFVRQDYARGSAPIRDAAVAQLRAALPLLKAQEPDGLRSRLLVATAALALVTGYMSFDVLQHEDARRLWVIALDIARKTEDPHAADLTVFLLYDLVLRDNDARTANRAVTSLGRAVELYGPGYARSKALYLPDLAGAHALAGDPGAAVTVGHQAVDAVSAVSSPRAHERLRTLRTVLEPMQASPGVAELRNRLTTTTAA